jgi:hypothetical protein
MLTHGQQPQGVVVGHAKPAGKEYEQLLLQLRYNNRGSETLSPRDGPATLEK